MCNLKGVTMLEPFAACFSDRKEADGYARSSGGVVEAGTLTGKLGRFVKS